MCGICGKVFSDPAREVDAQVIAAMMRTLVHRGPDDEGTYVRGQVGLGFRRLSIIDLQTGHQPLSNEDGTLWVIFNGEIYNYPELRAQLEQKGHRFRTNADTEAIVHAYEDSGPECVASLRGMFAFALWDERKRQLFIARDRMGEKPVFYHLGPEGLVFGSEIKALFADPATPKGINLAGMDSYLSLRFIPAPDTMYMDINKLPPAHYMLFRNGKLDIREYWSPSYVAKTEASHAETLERLRELMLESVKMRLMSDVPLGAFLSGGIDSSMIVALMSKTSPSPPQTFSIGVEDADYNELPYAEAVAEKWGTRHRSFLIKPDVLETLPKVISLMDEPTDPFAVSVYHVAGVTRKHVTVALGGDGGDELFGGYDRYFGNRYAGWLSHLPAFVRRGIVGPIADRIPESFSRKSLVQKARWLNRLSFHPEDRRYVESLTFFRFDAAAKEQLYTGALRAALNGFDPAERMLSYYNGPAAVDRVDRMMYVDMMTRLPDYTLLILDRMTMAHSLEGRSPFLDHKLVEFACSLPSRAKVHGRGLKLILKELARDYLPPQVLTRNKQGFGFPLNRWVRTDLRDMIRDSLLASRLIEDGYFSRDYVARILREHLDGRADHQMRIWSLLNMEIWYRDVFPARAVIAPGARSR